MPTARRRSQPGNHPLSDDRCRARHGHPRSRHGSHPLRIGRRRRIASKAIRSACHAPSRALGALDAPEPPLWTANGGMTVQAVPRADLDNRRGCRRSPMSARQLAASRMAGMRPAGHAQGRVVVAPLWFAGYHSGWCPGTTLEGSAGSEYPQTHGRCRGTLRRLVIGCGRSWTWPRVSCGPGGGAGRCWSCSWPSPGALCWPRPRGRCGQRVRTRAC